MQKSPTGQGPTAGAGALRRNYLSALENFAQSIGTMGPAATIGTVLPLLIYKSGNATCLMFLGILAAFGFISWCVTVFASRFVSAGSLSAYAQAGLGTWVGSLTGWSYGVAMVFVVASSGVSCTYYLTMVITHFTHAPVGTVGGLVLSSLVVLLAWWPAHHDIKLSTKLMLGLEMVSILLILGIMGAAMRASHAWVDRSQLRLEGASLSQVRLGFVLGFMTLAGFESATTLGEEAQSATRTLPRVLRSSLLPVGVLFLACIYGLTALSHGRNLALDQTDAPLDMIAQSLGLPALGWVSSLGIAISCFGCALGGFNAGSRVVYAMARNGQLWRYFARVHPVNGTPHRALALLAAISVLVPGGLLCSGLTLANAMDYLLQLASFGFLGGYFAVCVATPFFLARRSELAPVRTVLATAAVAMIGAAIVLTVFPVPDAPWRYFPYLFLSMLATGMLISGRCAAVSANGAAASPARDGTLAG